MNQRFAPIQLPEGFSPEGPTHAASPGHLAINREAPMCGAEADPLRTIYSLDRALVSCPPCKEILELAPCSSCAGKGIIATKVRLRAIRKRGVKLTLCSSCGGSGHARGTA